MCQPIGCVPDHLASTAGVDITIEQWPIEAVMTQAGIHSSTLGFGVLPRAPQSQYARGAQTPPTTPPQLFHSDSVPDTADARTHTSFCEEDYAITVYVCEFFNTLTNLAYGRSGRSELPVPLIWAQMVHTNLHETVYYAFASPRAPGRKGVVFGMDAMAMSLVFVGVFSAIFHASLHSETQFLDEMSMFFLGSAFLQPLYTKGFSGPAQTAITTVILSVVAVISAVYYQTRIVELHWGAFFVIENLIWPRALYIIYSRPRPTAERARLFRQFWTATGVMALALLVWVVDLELCPPLRALRARVGLPWAHLLELHGWWHIFTAVSASKYIRLIREICQ